MSDWHWINLPGDRHEQVVADLEALGTGLGRGMIVIQTNATSSFHVSFSHEEKTRDQDVPCLRFVVGKRRNSMTSVGLGNPYIKKEPIDFTKQPEALLTTDPEKSRTYWFLYDRVVQVAAMGVQAVPQADVCRLLCRFRDSTGFRAEVCEQLRYIIVSSGKRPVSLRIVHLGPPLDLSIPRYQFDPVSWQELPWQGCSCVFQLDEEHRELMKRVQKLLTDSPLGPLYQLVPADALCLNVVRLLDPFRQPELQGEDWRSTCEEVKRSLEPVLQSAAWTYWPLRYDRADAASVSLAPVSNGLKACVSAWVKAVEEASGLRNALAPREFLSLSFAYEVFPVEGEQAFLARRQLVREIKALLEQEWQVMDFKEPLLARWHSKSQWRPV